jgi:hypothetical protein
MGPCFSSKIDLTLWMLLHGIQLAAFQWPFLTTIPYFNDLYFNGFFISTAAYFNDHIFQFLMTGGSLLRDTTLLECPARAVASLRLRASVFPIVSL